MITKKNALAIASILAPAAAERVALAFDDPKAYAKKYRQALRDRNLTEVDPWIGLVDALEEQGVLASIDWKTDAEELGQVIRRLSGKPLRWPKGVDQDERSTAELLEIIGERLLREQSVALAHLDIGADEYELVLVPRAQAKRLQALGDIQVFTGSGLAKLERARLANQKKARAKEDQDPDRQRQYVHPDGRVLLVWGKTWHADGKRYHAWMSIQTMLGKDWSKVPTHSASEKPHIDDGFVEVTREEWLRQAAEMKKAKKAKKAKKKTGPR
jgi:hypothetical protein